MPHPKVSQRTRKLVLTLKSSTSLTVLACYNKYQRNTHCGEDNISHVALVGEPEYAYVPFPVLALHIWHNNNYQGGSGAKTGEQVSFLPQRSTTANWTNPRL